MSIHSSSKPAFDNLQTIDELAYKTLSVFKVVREKYFNNIPHILEILIDIEKQPLRQFIVYTNRILKGKLLNELVEECTKTITNYDILRSDLEKPFLLFVVGTGKYGKSTLINALLQEDIAEIGVLPKTWKIDIYENSNNTTSKVTIIHNDEKKLEMDCYKARIYLLQEERKREASEERIFTLYQENCSKLRSIEEKEEYKKALESNYLYISPVVEVRWPIKPNSLLERFRLVDTPGLAQELLGEVRLGVKDYYYKADGVIWLIDATKISASTSREMIRDLNNTIQEIGARTDNIIAVLNRIDIVYQNGGEEGSIRVLSEAKLLYKDFFQEIIPVSAKLAFEGYIKQDIEMIRRSGIDHLLTHINNVFMKDAQKMRMTSKTIAIKQYAHNITGVLANYHKKLNCDLNEAKQFIPKLDSNVEKFYNEQIMNLQIATDVYKQKVNKNLHSSIKEIAKIKNNEVRSQYIRETVFLTSELNSTMQSLKIVMNNEMRKLAIFLGERAKISEYSYIDDSLFIGLNSFDFKLPELHFQNNFTIDDDACIGGAGIGALIGSIIFPGLGTLIGAAAGYLLTSGLSSSVTSDRIKELSSTLDKMLLEIHKEFENNLSTCNSVVKTYVLKIQETSFEKLHCPLQNAEDLSKKVADMLNELRFNNQKDTESEVDAMFLGNLFRHNDCKRSSIVK